MKKNGFTLVEMIIVLTIIGLIMSGIMKGKNVIRSAEQKKAYNTWIKEWVMTANEYQDRTGSILGDGTANGGTSTDEDSRFDNVSLWEATTVQDRLKAVGLDLVQGNVSSTKGGSYILKGKYQTNQAKAYLYWLGSTTNGYKNRLYITGVPTDYAIAWDKIMDGKADAQSGDFRMYKDDKPWPNAEQTKTVSVMIEI